jgi:hypothetical protein
MKSESSPQHRALLSLAIESGFQPQAPAPKITRGTTCQKLALLRFAAATPRPEHVVVFWSVVSPPATNRHSRWAAQRRRCLDAPRGATPSPRSQQQKNSCCFSQVPQRCGCACAVRPNHSLKVSPNGVAHWACGAGPSAHFAPHARRATPLGPP